MTAALEPLANLPYFVSWGGDAALTTARRALEKLSEEGLSGKRVLEIGASRGKMSCLFGLLGAHVTGIDVDPEFPAMARAEAEKWGVLDRMDFHKSPGSLERLPDASFDLVFTKSVLLFFKDLEPYMRELSTKLKPGGRICFLENRSRNAADRLLRNLIHLKRGARNYHYMDARRIEEIGRVFELDDVQAAMNPLFGSRTPGWYLILGHRR